MKVLSVHTFCFQVAKIVIIALEKKTYESTYVLLADDIEHMCLVTELTLE